MKWLIHIFIYFSYKWNWFLFLFRDILKFIKSNNLKKQDLQVATPSPSVSQKDVQPSPVAQPQPMVIPGEEEEFVDIPLSGMRRTIAKRLTESKVCILCRVRAIVFNATFNNISVISWLSFIGGGNRSTQRKYRPVTSHWQTLSHNVVLRTPRHL